MFLRPRPQTRSLDARSGRQSEAALVMQHPRGRLVRFTTLLAALPGEQLSASRSRVRWPSYCRHGGAGGSLFRKGSRRRHGRGGVLGGNDRHLLSASPPFLGPVQVSFSFSIHSLIVLVARIYLLFGFESIHLTVPVTSLWRTKRPSELSSSSNNRL